MRGWLVLLWLTLWLSACPTASDAGLIVLENVRLSDGRVTNLVIERDRIKALSDTVPEGATVRACQGMTVLPGFIDAHVHLGFYKPDQLLAGGLTVVRDLGWDPELSLAWQKASVSDLNYRGPLVVAAGPMFTAPGGYPLKAGWAPPGTGRVYRAGEVEKVVRAGAGLIKVTLEPRSGPTLDLATLKRLVKEAHDAQRLVSAHVSTAAELEKALEAGVDELSHLMFDNSELPEALLQRMLAQEVAVVPTLRVNPHPNRLKNLARFYQGGGRVLFGTDLGNWWTSRHRRRRTAAHAASRNDAGRHSSLGHRS